MIGTEIGLSIGVSAREDLRRFVELARLAETSQIDCMWVIDSHLAMKDVYTAMSVGLWETDRLQFGTGVTNFQTRDVTVTASTIATMATMAPGRVLAGVGAGDSAVFPLGRKPSTVAELRSGISDLQRLLAGDEIEGGGGPVKLPFTPDPTPPVFLSASQPRMLRLSGEQADGVIVLGAADRDLTHAQIALAREGAREAGRGPHDVFIDVWVVVSVDDDASRAIDDVRSWASAKARWMAGWKQLPGSLEQFRPQMKAAAESYDFSAHLSVGAGHASVVSDELASALAVAGDVDHCTSRLAELTELGMDRLTITLLSRNREQRLGTLVNEVLPGLRG